MSGKWWDRGGMDDADPAPRVKLASEAQVLLVRRLGGSSDLDLAMTDAQRVAARVQGVAAFAASLSAGEASRLIARAHALKDRRMSDASERDQWVELS